MADTRRKTLRIGAEPHSPTEEDLQLINDLSPTPLTADEVTVRSMILCTGDYDRDYERFTVEVLEQFASTLVGKSLLIGHRHDSHPEGLFYRAEVLRRPGATPALRAWAYLPKTPANDHVRTLMDTGVIRYVSIGFRAEKLLCDLCGSDLLTTNCGHLPGREYGGTVAQASWAGEAEAVEGSLVYLGSQYDAVLLKSLEPPAPDPHVLEERLESTLRELDERKAEVERLRPLAADGLLYRKELEHEFRALATLAGETDCLRSLEARLPTMCVAELRDHCERVSRKAEWLAAPRVCGHLRAPRPEPDLTPYARL